MLKLNTRYVIRSPRGTEKVIKIETPEEVSFFSKYLTQGYSFTEVVIHQMQTGCESCQA